MFDFSHFSIINTIDFLLVATLLYYFYRLVKGTVAINIFIGIAMLYLVWLLTKELKMKLLSELLGKFLGVGVLALIIVFQQEIRRFLLALGSTKFSPSGNLIQKLGIKGFEQETTDVKAIIEAIKSFSKDKTGALILLARNTNLDFLKNNSDQMDIKLNKPILQSIFFKNSPLHDGAVIIEGNHITATRAVIPVTGEIKLPKSYGLRHRAAVSITQNTDALAIVVSEETGKVSYLKNGKFVPFKTYENMEEMIRYDLSK